MASNCLHYSEDWQRACSASAGQHYQYTGDRPAVAHASSFVFAQRLYGYGCNTEYLGLCLNRAEFLEWETRLGVRLMREFVYGCRSPVHGAPEQNEYRGALFGR